VNTTYISQPPDGGIIKNFKGNYRRLMTKPLLVLINSGEKIDSKSISLLDTLLMIQSVWNDVKQTTIQNCFRKCGFELNTSGGHLQKLSRNLLFTTLNITHKTP